MDKAENKEDMDECIKKSKKRSFEADKLKYGVEKMNPDEFAFVLNVIDKNNIKTFENKMFKKKCWLLFTIICTLVLYILTIQYSNLDKISIVSLSFATFIGIFLSLKQYLVDYINESKNIYKTVLHFPIENNALRLMSNWILKIFGDVNMDDDEENFKCVITHRDPYGNPGLPGITYGP